jgi:hypothetical protein
VCGFRGGAQLFDADVERGVEAGSLVGEMIVESRAGNPGGADDVGDRRRREGLLRGNLNYRFDYSLTLRARGEVERQGRIEYPPPAFGTRLFLHSRTIVSICRRVLSKAPFKQRCLWLRLKCS